MYKSLTFSILILAVITACTPVLQRDLIRSGSLDINPTALKKNTSVYEGKLYILGGIIAKTTVTEEGSLIEALYVPVNSRGYLKDTYQPSWRFLALNKGDAFLDPLVFGEKREVTIAGIFKGVRHGKIGEREYSYPLFEIKEIYLWDDVKDRDRYFYPDYYPYSYFRFRPYYPAYPYYYWWYY